MDFDVNSFLDQSTTAASEARPPVPAGEYISTIQDIEVVPWQSKDKVDPVTGQLRSGIRFEIKHLVDIPAEIAAAVKLTQPTLTLTDRVMIDLTPERQIDYGPGRNGRIRQYREATNLNVAGSPFSPRMMVGRQVRVRLTLEEYQGRWLEQIAGVTRVA